MPALVEAGLPLTSVEPLLQALSSGNDAIAAVPGVTQRIVEIAVAAMKTAYFKAFKVVYVTSLAFGCCAVIASWWTPRVEDRLTHDVVRRLAASGHGNLQPVADPESKATVEQLEKS